MSSASCKLLPEKIEDKTFFQFIDLYLDLKNVSILFNARSWSISSASYRLKVYKKW